MKRRIFIILLLILVLFGCGQKRNENFIPRGESGTIDLTKWNFDRDGLAKLDGEWEFYWNQLINPEDFYSGKKYNMSAYYNAPSHWGKKKYQGNNKTSGEGYGTYRLKLLLTPDHKFRSVRIGSQGLSYKVWLNGKIVAENGKITTGEKEKVIIKNYENRFIFLNNLSEYDIVIQVSNYSRNTGGLWGSLTMGDDKDNIKALMAKNVADSIFIGIFAIMGLYSLILYFIRKDEMMFLYMGLFSLAVSARIIISGNILNVIFYNGIEANLKLKIIHINFTVVVIFLVLFLKEMYKEYISKRLVTFVLRASYLFLFIVVFLDNNIYDSVFPIYEAIIFGMIIISAKDIFYTVIKNKENAAITLVGLVAFISSSVNDILYSTGIINTCFIISYGFFFFTLSQALIMVKKYYSVFINMENMSKRLVVMDKLKDEFLANTSHELRTPLNGIIGITESLIFGVEGELNEKVLKNLKIVVSSGKRLSNLINDILDMSKIKKGSIELNSQNINIRLLVDAVISISEVLIRKKNLIIENMISENVYVYADENKLNQILYNLIGNAVKFTNSGKIWVESEIRDDMVVITVGDTGIGIPKDKINLIFESFFQVESSETRKYSGTGLGLSITKTLVELHGGEIHVESEEGKGSKFKFSLKKASVKDINEVDTLLGVKQREAEENYEDYIKVENKKQDMNRTILVIDDDYLNIQVISNLMKNEKFNLIYALNGKDGLEIIDREKIDIVLLDIMMPILSGYEVTEIIRKKYDKINLPIILLTARSQTDDITEAFKRGANDYIVKPIVKEELLSRVNTILMLKESINGMIESAGKYEYEKSQREFIAKQEEFIKALTSTLEIDLVMKHILMWIKDNISYESAAIFINEDNAIKYFYIDGEIREKTVKFKPKDFDEKLSDVMKLETPKLIYDSNLNIFKNTNTKAVVPILYNGKKTGIILINLDKKNLLSEAKLNFVSSFITHSGLAVENAKLFKEIQEQTKLKTILRLSKAIVREIRTPISVIKGYANMERHKNEGDEGTARRMDIIENETDKIEEMTFEILEYSGGNEHNYEYKNLILLDLIKEIIKNMEQELTLNQIEVVMNIRKELLLYGDENRLKKMFEAIIKNSVEAADFAKKRKYIEISADENEKINIKIFDNGIGVNEKMGDGVFEPFVTTKIQGTGFGLTIAKEICEKHGAEITINSEEKNWTEVSLKFKKKGQI